LAKIKARFQFRGHILTHRQHHVAKKVRFKKKNKPARAIHLVIFVAMPLVSGFAFGFEDAI
jgi:hypothetical protein